MTDSDRDQQPELDALSNQPDEAGEDRFLIDSLNQLPKVKVPAGFLPVVMDRVYEKHARDQVAPGKVASIAGLLFGLFLLFFCLEARDYQQQAELASFGEAFAGLVDQGMGQMDYLMSAFAGVFTAAWQLVASGASAYLSGGGAIGKLVVFFLALAIVGFVFKTMITRLSR